ncbi:unnamed protein product [Linum trigynum]|uniref:Uncharacterized protein n=1 Tax=Linum trigynum TaxID=586398 RepID=A0AAV2EP41_9ROSI
MVTDAFNATFLPQFDRINRRLDELKVLTNKAALPKNSAVKNPISEMNHDRSIPSKFNPTIEECIRKLSESWAKEKEASSGSKVEKEAAACRLCFSPAKQSFPSVVPVAALEDDSEDFVASDQFIDCPGTTSHSYETPEQTVGDRTPPLTRTQKLCRFSAAQSSEIDDLVVTYGDDSRPPTDGDTFPMTPGTSSAALMEENEP